jgi:hypothetical protein
MTDVTRTSTSKLSGAVYTASTNQNALAWAKQFTNTLSGGNSVTFSPYGHSNWKRLIKQGSEVTSRIDGVEYVISDSEFQFLDMDKVVSATGVFFGNGFFGARGSALAYATAPSNTTASLNRADAQALGALAKSIYSAQHAFNGSTFVGELRESLRMLKHPVSGLQKGMMQYLKDAKRVIRKSATVKKAVKNVSNTWLEYSYGWRPLVSDIHSAANAIANICTFRMPRKTVHAFGIDTAGDVSPTKGSDNYGTVSIKYTKNQTCVAEVKYTACVQLSVGSRIDVAVQELGLDFPSFVPTLWEIIPYSFLVDYFSNIGGIIQAVSNPSSACAWVVKGTSVTNHCKVAVYDCTITPSGNPYATRTRLIWKPANDASWSKKTVTRSSYGGSLVPSLRLQIPSFGTKWLNMGALAASHQDAIKEFSIKRLVDLKLLRGHNI